MSLQEAFDLALGLFQAGRFAEAESVFRQIVSAQPEHVDSLHMLGMTLLQLNRPLEAEPLVRTALTINPMSAATHSLLGHVLFALGRAQEAIAPAREGVRLAPDLPDAYGVLGLVLSAAGRRDEAVQVYQTLLERHPQYPEGWYNLGNVLHEMNRDDEAIAAYRQAVALRPQWFDALSNLGYVLQERGDPEAIVAYQMALSLKPDSAWAAFRLASALWTQHRRDDAIRMWRRAIEIDPAFVEAYNSLGVAYRDTGELDKAITCLQAAIRINPAFFDSHANLGNTLRDRARLPEALAEFREAIRLRPGFQPLWSNLLYSMHFDPASDLTAIAREHERWNHEMAIPQLLHDRPHCNVRDPDRRLRIGYVSPDFYAQAESFFVLPLLAAHDRAQFEIHCYSSVRDPDAVTQRLQAHADRWHNVLKLSDAQLAEKISDDQIDILIDLTMHMNNSRILAFARKPAPVQAAWLAYPGTTGLRAIDYRITDRCMDPEGSDQFWSAEEPLRLPDAWCVYQPLAEDAAEVQPLPAMRKGYVTFGSMNHSCKTGDSVLRLWARVMNAIPNSRLVLGWPKGSSQDVVRDRFAAEGIAPQRLELLPILPRPQYLEMYSNIDLGLDPFPYNGITTTCDAMWMGVPVLTLAGVAPAARAGASLMNTVGLPQFVAHSQEQYVSLAIQLANDLDALCALRDALRKRMQASPLMDASRFARNMESLYRDAWRRYCAK